MSETPYISSADGILQDGWDVADAWKAEAERLRAIIDGLECVHSHGNPNWRCAKLGNVKLCQVCAAKSAAAKPDAGEVVDAGGDLC